MASEKLIHTILNDLEKDTIRIFVNNKTMYEAVKKVLLAGLYSNGTLKPGEPATPLRNVAFSLASNRGESSNEMLGQDLRALWEGINALESAFGQFKEFEVVPGAPKPLPKNKAR